MICFLAEKAAAAVTTVKNTIADTNLKEKALIVITEKAATGKDITTAIKKKVKMAAADTAADDRAQGAKKIAKKFPITED